MPERPIRERTLAGDAPSELPNELPGRGPGEDRAKQRALRRVGQPFDRQNPFVVGFVGTLGVVVAVAVAAAVYSIRGTLVLVGLALFIAVGLEPVVALFTRHRVRRPIAVLVVVAVAAGIVAAFVYSAISPIEHEINQLSVQIPKWRTEIGSGKGSVGKIAQDLHLSYYLSGKGSVRGASTPTWHRVHSAPARKLSSAVSSLLVVTVLTIYFLAALPSIKGFLTHLVPDSRRSRFGLLLDEVLAGVGGYLLGNLLTSLIAGIGTLVWAAALGLPYVLLLALMVALFDLIPVVGSTVAGVIVSLVALSVSLPVAIATAVFYIAYRFVEDYFLVPRVMRQAVNVSPVVTVLGVIIGAALLGIIGALVAIPVAAGIKLVVEQTVFPRLDKS